MANLENQKLTLLTISEALIYPRGPSNNVRQRNFPCRFFRLFWYPGGCVDWCYLLEPTKKVPPELTPAVVSEHLASGQARRDHATSQQSKQTGKTSVPNCGDFSPNGRFLASSWRPLFCKNRQRNLGDFWHPWKMGNFGRNLQNYLAKWAISDHFWQNVTLKSADFGAIFSGGDFLRKISPIWRILIKRSWEHWEKPVRKLALTDVDTGAPWIYHFEEFKVWIIALIPENWNSEHSKLS